MNKKNLVGSAALLIFFIFACIACRQQEVRWGGTIEQENGVTVVKNPKEPMHGEDAFILSEELSIGEEKGREEYMFSEVISIAMDEEERIYVLDYKENCVKIFNKDGLFVRKFGRPGQGPGEFYLPRFVMASGPDEILVHNYNRIEYFSLDGEHKKSLSTATARLLTADFDSEGNILGLEIVRDEINPRYELKKYDPDLNYLHSLGSSPLPSSSRDGFNPFFPVLRWDVLKGNQVVCGYMKEYEMKIFDSDGHLIKKIMKEYTPVKVTEEDVEERLRGEELPAQLKENMTIPEYHCPFRWIMTDDEGRIFVMTYERIEGGEGCYYDIFDADGRYSVRIPLKTRPLLIRNHKLYAVEEDEEGYQRVKRYGIVWQK